MKKKLLKIENVATKPQGNARQAVKDTTDEAYVQVNRVSFQQNFKSLIGHYKTGIQFEESSQQINS